MRSISVGLTSVPRLSLFKPVYSPVDHPIYFHLSSTIGIHDNQLINIEWIYYERKEDIKAGIIPTRRAPLIFSDRVQGFTRIVVPVERVVEGERRSLEPEGQVGGYGATTTVPSAAPEYR